MEYTATVVLPAGLNPECKPIPDRMPNFKCVAAMDWNHRYYEPGAIQGFSGSSDFEQTEKGWKGQDGSVIGGNDAGLKLFVTTLIVIIAALPFVAMGLNAAGKVSRGGITPSSTGGRTGPSLEWPTYSQKQAIAKIWSIYGVYIILAAVLVPIGVLRPPWVEYVKQKWIEDLGRSKPGRNSTFDKADKATNDALGTGAIAATILIGNILTATASLDLEANKQLPWNIERNIRVQISNFIRKYPEDPKSALEMAVDGQKDNLNPVVLSLLEDLTGGIKDDPISRQIMSNIPTERPVEGE